MNISNDTFYAFEWGNLDINIVLKNISSVTKKRRPLTTQDILFRTGIPALIGLGTAGQYTSHNPSETLTALSLMASIDLLSSWVISLPFRGYRNYITIENVNGERFIVYSGVKTRQLLKLLKAKNISIVKDTQFQIVAC